MNDIDGLIVQTEHGPLRGLRIRQGNGWRGIRYAAPPVGALRFRAPQPVEPWRDVRDATRFGPVSLQSRGMASAGGSGQLGIDEDCLNLNVAVPHTPGDATSAARPVIVWIHGGAFTVGTGSNYPGGRLAAVADAVVVTLNYRLGATGFLDFSRFSTSERKFEGNLGLRDMIAALQWVRANIAAFGGDPGNVTLMGESAGAISALALMCSPAAEGLFHRVIAQSPPPKAVVDAESAAHWAGQFIGFLGVRRQDAAAALDSAAPEALVAASSALAELHYEATPGVLVHCPVIDEEVLPRRPVDVFAAGHQAPVPLLIGTNDNEGRLFQIFRNLTRTEMLPVTERMLDRMFALTDPTAKERVLAAYPGYPSRPDRAQVSGDLIFWVPSTQVAADHSRRAPTYMYRFDQATPPTRLLRIGATHGTELPFVFGQVEEPTFPLGTSPTAKRTSSRMRRMWGRFAAIGAPDVRWPTYDDTRRATMIIDDEWHVEHDPRSVRRRAWAGYRGWSDGEGRA